LYLVLEGLTVIRVPQIISRGHRDFPITSQHGDNDTRREFFNIHCLASPHGFEKLTTRPRRPEDVRLVDFDPDGFCEFSD
jgi:hypothetical protein